MTAVFPESSPALAVNNDAFSLPHPSHRLRFLDVTLEADFQDFLRRKGTSSRCDFFSPHLLLTLSLCAIATLAGLGSFYDCTDRNNFEEKGKYQIVGCGLLICVVFLFDLAVGCCRERRSARRSLQVALWMLTAVWLAVESACLSLTAVDPAAGEGGPLRWREPPIAMALLSTPVFSSLMDSPYQRESVPQSTLQILLEVAMVPSFRCKTMLFTLVASTVVCLHLAIGFCAASKSPLSLVFDFLLMSLGALFCDVALLTDEKLVRAAFVGRIARERTNKSLSGSFPKRDEASLAASGMLAVPFVLHESAEAAVPLMQKASQDGEKLPVSTPEICIQINHSEGSDLSESIDADDREFVKQNYMALEVPEYARDEGKAEEVSTPHAKWLLDYGLSELHAVLNQIGKNWNFDMFFLQEVTKGKALSVCGRFCLLKYDLLSKLRIEETEAENFFTAIEAKYRPNLYHNSCHGADVLNSMLYLVLHSKAADLLTSLEIVGITISALSHDVGHKALTNRFLVNSRDQLAIRYNDTSVLEMMHAAETYATLQEEDKNILRNLDADAWMLVRKVVLKVILATDMSRHFDMLNEFKATHGSALCADLTKMDERLLIYEMCIKAGDIGHAAKEIALHEKWTLLVCEEFFQQGDLEKSQKLAVSMYCDRDTTNVPKSQIGFIQNVVLPLYEALNSYIGSAEISEMCIEQLRANQMSWERQLRRRRRFTIKGSHHDFSQKTSDFEELAEKVRSWKRGKTDHKKSAEQQPFV